MKVISILAGTALAATLLILGTQVVTSSKVTILTPTGTRISMDQFQATHWDHGVLYCQTQKGPVEINPGSNVVIVEPSWRWRWSK